MLLVSHARSPAAKVNDAYIHQLMTWAGLYKQLRRLIIDKSLLTEASQNMSAIQSIYSSPDLV